MPHAEQLDELRGVGVEFHRREQKVVALYARTPHEAVQVGVADGEPAAPRPPVPGMTEPKSVICTAYRGMGGLIGVLGMDGPWDIRRILGTVPLEEDGSVMFGVPANTPMSIQPLDAEGKAVPQSNDVTRVLLPVTTACSPARSPTQTSSSV